MSHLPPLSTGNPKSSEMARPNRSDVHLSSDEAARIAGETREYFDGIAPKRHTKPSRSDHSAQYKDALDSYDQNPTQEFTKFQDLETHTEKLIYAGSEAPEEFTETEYYKDLNDLDKQHHTTGTGFIKTENANGSSFALASDSDVSGCHASCQGNPATNEWTPAANSTIPVSNKPPRSDN